MDQEEKEREIKRLETKAGDEKKQFDKTISNLQNKDKASEKKIATLTSTVSRQNKEIAELKASIRLQENSLKAEKNAELGRKYSAEFNDMLQLMKTTCAKTPVGTGKYRKMTQATNTFKTILKYSIAGGLYEDEEKIKEALQNVFDQFLDHTLRVREDTVWFQISSALSYCCCFFSCKPPESASGQYMIEEMNNNEKIKELLNKLPKKIYYPNNVADYSQIQEAVRLDNFVDMTKIISNSIKSI